MTLIIKKEGACTLCPRRCGARRGEGETGLCGGDGRLKIARAALHFWEEPCISGERGSGAVFFSGCPLDCVFCQNGPISSGGFGKEISVSRLSEIFLELQAQGAHNINLVTPTHYAPEILEAARLARRNGLALPLVYNSSGYERRETLRLFQGTADIYLPDFKYYDNGLAARYSRVSDYRETAERALDEMVAQTGPCVFDGDGLLQKGVVVRHLMLPGLLEDSKAVLRRLWERYGNEIYVSIMNQYTPFGNLEAFPELRRRVTAREYDQGVDFALSLGITQGFIQEEETASESFIPLFDLTGVEPREARAEVGSMPEKH